MRFVTVEFLRFGGSTGQLSRDNTYLRTIGVTGPGSDVPGPLDAHLFDRLIAKIDHSAFTLGADRAVLLENGRLAAAGLRTPIEEFVELESIVAAADEELIQLEIVTRASELAMVPFEVLEDDESIFVVTRRLRRPDIWPKTIHPRNGKPRILFAWSQAYGAVPHAEHLQALQEITDMYDGVLDVIENATLTQIAEQLEAAGDHPYSHVHLLAHGLESPQADPLQPVDLSQPPGPPFLLGFSEPTTPAALAAVFGDRDDRPSVVTLAACDAGRVDPAIGAYSFAHALHAAGVHVVVASQFPLTKKGSVALVREFIFRSVQGEDPRAALRETRRALRATGDETYFDHFAVVGYVHLNEDSDLNDSTRRALAATLSKLKATKKRLDAQSEASEGSLAWFEELRSSYAEIRQELAVINDGTLTEAETEECLGLVASSLKRESEAAYVRSNQVTDDERDEMRSLSAELLAEARDAYEKAAEFSLDHHWVWVQWLALEAVLDSDAIVGRSIELHVVRLAAERAPENRHWAIGTLLEAWALSAALPEPFELEQSIKELVAELDECCRATGNNFALTTTLDQMRRYITWWSEPEWNVHPAIAARAQQVVTALLAVAPTD